ncbi:MULTISPECIES: GspH/FimT family pseudopilin [Pseudomonas]|uniref:Type II secretion system protein H n=1 Tax=Pseudomonas nitroreducens TaxID=46680 RepID=A0A246F3M2_PSENT|nr:MULTISPECIES: GspH/FimT family pseudopilin [Pseudomonas]MCG8908887.1 GspH/FimT family pseudopilin [Pseudomonas sp. DP-17]OWP47603.1 pilus assembly protein FimT [Pseudomonas nitroreducens]
MPRPKGSAGFTLVELMIVVSVVAIFASIAVPSFSTVITNSRLQSASNELASLIQFARSAAVQNNQSMNLCSSNGIWSVRKSCTDTSAAVLRSFTPPTGVTISASVSSLTFRSNGTASGAANLIACSNDAAASGYKMSVQASGFVRLYPQGKDGSSALSSCTPS